MRLNYIKRRRLRNLCFDILCDFSFLLGKTKKREKKANEGENGGKVSLSFLFSVMTDNHFLIEIPQIKHLKQCTRGQFSHRVRFHSFDFVNLIIALSHYDRRGQFSFLFSLSFLRRKGNSLRKLPKWWNWMQYAKNDRANRRARRNNCTFQFVDRMRKSKQKENK